MELLAQGRDCDIFDRGDGTVLRRSRKDHNQTHEARLMTWVGEQGYPVPRVQELADDGQDLIMEKIAGPTMLQAIERRPWRAGAIGAQLAELHTELHRIAAPDWLRTTLPGGEALLHFDLHPLNVILSPRGPVVIDWTNACRGFAGYDPARAWALMASAEGGVGWPLRLILTRVRRSLVDGFVQAVGPDEARAGLAYAVELTLLDPNISDAEKAQMQALADAEAPTAQAGEG